jgi:hypothetical protein
MDDIIEPASTPRPRRQDALVETLREDAPTAQISPATETARHDDEANPPTRQGQVGNAAEIAAVIRSELVPHPGQRLNLPARRTVITVVAPS